MLETRSKEEEEEAPTQKISAMRCADGDADCPLDSFDLVSSVHTHLKAKDVLYAESTSQMQCGVVRAGGTI